MSTLNSGKENIGALNNISYGDQSPDTDAVPLAWRAGDFRFYIGTDPHIIGWRCTVGGTPGTWILITNAAFDLFLSFGDQSGDGALGIPPEATPEFYLRPNTNKTVQMSFSGSPGAVWEYEVTEPISGTLVLDLFVYSCGLTPAGAGPATLKVVPTINGAAVFLTANLDGLVNTRVVNNALATVVAGDRVGVLVTTTNVGSGFLMMTAHLRIA